MTESLGPYALDSRWQANERRPNEIAAMTGLGREMHAAESERLEGEQDAVEHALGFDRPADAVSRRWSGANVDVSLRKEYERLIEESLKSRDHLGETQSREYRALVESLCGSNLDEIQWLR
jgi:hypothetical protein